MNAIVRDDANLERALDQIARWNSRYPAGTLVAAAGYPDTPRATRGAAALLDRRKPVAYLEGLNGYFDLADLRPLSVAATPAATRRDLAVMFAGQGSQSRGMGRELFAAFPQQTRLASDVLGYSIERLCLEDPDRQLNDTAYTQPAVYVVNALGFMRKRLDGDPAADAEFFLGHSLGEYNALEAAGAFDFETGLRLVAKRGELMGRVRGGGMAAVLGIEADRVRVFLDREGFEGIDLANFNTPTQTVISGPAEALEPAIQALARDGVNAVPLKVSAAFHSRYMRAIEQEFAAFAGDFCYDRPQRTVIANTDALPYENNSIISKISAQISTPVRWQDSVRFLLDQQVSEFLEINSEILGKMVAEIKRS